MAKVVGGGVLGIALAAVILKVGFKAGWFGGGSEGAGEHMAEERDANARRPFPRFQEPPAQRKLPPPSAEAREKLQAEIDGAFADQLSTELPDEQKRNLARQIIHLADDARERPDERYMLLVKAGDLAVEGGDLSTMGVAAYALDAEYTIEENELRETWLRRFAETADEAGEIESLVAHAKHAIDQALAEDRYDDALALADATLTACRRPGGEQRREFVQQGRDKIVRLRDAWPRFQDARDKLKSDPDDPQANLIVGRWLCLEKDAWNGGVAYLAKGGDDPLAEAARMDRAVAAGAPLPEKQIEIADRWFDLAMSDEANRGCLGRAFHWYRAAEGALSGEQATHVEQRLDIIFQEAAAQGLMPETSSNQ